VEIFAECLGSLEQTVANYRERVESFGLAAYPSDHHKLYQGRHIGFQKEVLVA